MEIASYEFQTRILILMVVNEEFGPAYRPSLSSDWWDAPEHVAVAGTILDYLDQYKHTPDWVNLLHHLQALHPKPPEHVSSWREYLKGLQRIAKSTNGNLAYVYDQAEKFIRHKTLAVALTQAHRCWETGSYDQAVEAMREYERRVIRPVDGIDFMEGIYDRLSNPHIRPFIPTGLLGVDTALDGGAGRSELSFVMAPTGVGKTTWLINIGAVAVLHGHRVYHFYAEQTQDLIWGRYVRRFMRRNLQDLQAYPKRSTLAIQSLIKKCGGSLRIASCSGRTVEDMRSYIYRHGTPDLVVIDYADLMVPAARYSDIRHELRRVYQDIIRLAKEFNFAAWTGSQTNRGAMKKKFVDLDDVGEAWAKNEEADNVVTLSQSREDRRERRMTAHIAKGRNVSGGQQTVQLRIDYGKMWIYQDATSSWKARLSTLKHNPVVAPPVVPDDV